MLLLCTANTQLLPFLASLVPYSRTTRCVLKYIGRKDTMDFGPVVTGVFVFWFIISSHSNFELAFTCLDPISQHVIDSALYEYTPEFLLPPI